MAPKTSTIYDRQRWLIAAYPAAAPGGGDKGKGKGAYPAAAPGGPGPNPYVVIAGPTGKANGKKGGFKGDMGGVGGMGGMGGGGVDFKGGGKGGKDQDEGGKGGPAGPNPYVNPVQGEEPPTTTTTTTSSSRRRRRSRSLQPTRVYLRPKAMFR